MCKVIFDYLGFGMQWDIEQVKIILKQHLGFEKGIQVWNDWRKYFTENDYKQKEANAEADWRNKIKV